MGGGDDLGVMSQCVWFGNELRDLAVFARLSHSDQNIEKTKRVTP